MWCYDFLGFASKEYKQVFGIIVDRNGMICDTSMGSMTEICRDSWVPFEDDGQIHEIILVPPSMGAVQDWKEYLAFLRIKD